MEPARPAYIPQLNMTGMCMCTRRNVTNDWHTSTYIVYISSQVPCVFPFDLEDSDASTDIEDRCSYDESERDEGDIDDGDGDSNDEDHDDKDDDSDIDCSGVITDICITDVKSECLSNDNQDKQHIYSLY